MSSARWQANMSAMTLAIFIQAALPVMQIISVIPREARSNKSWTGLRIVSFFIEEPDYDRFGAIWLVAQLGQDCQPDCL